MPLGRCSPTLVVLELLARSRSVPGFCIPAWNPAQNVILHIYVLIRWVPLLLVLRIIFPLLLEEHLRKGRRCLFFPVSVLLVLLFWAVSCCGFPGHVCTSGPFAQVLCVSQNTHRRCGLLGGSCLWPCERWLAGCITGCLGWFLVQLQLFALSQRCSDVGVSSGVS